MFMYPMTIHQQMSMKQCNAKISSWPIRGWPQLPAAGRDIPASMAMERRYTIKRKYALSRSLLPLHEGSTKKSPI
jgi:hypothetical protein